VRWLLFTGNIVPSSPILVTLMMEALDSSVTSVLTRATRHNISEDGTLNGDNLNNIRREAGKIFQEGRGYD
jgi:hypothetical protein